MLTLALLTALGHENELAMHVRAAVRNGVTAAEIREVLLHTAVYAGVPASQLGVRGGPAGAGRPRRPGRALPAGSP